MEATTTRIELGQRSGAGIDVTLIWAPGTGQTVACVSDLALDVYHHPFAYRDFSAVDYEDSRLVAAAAS
jgi:hypothetical protein